MRSSLPSCVPVASAGFVAASALHNFWTCGERAWHFIRQEARLERYIIGNATALQTDLNATKRDMDISWLIICGALVFFMQAGFAMLEAGIVQSKNMANILFKNMVDASIAAVCFWLVGYGFAYGTDRTGDCWAR